MPRNGRSGGDPVADRLDEARGSQPVHRRRGGAHAGHDEQVGAVEVLGSRRRGARARRRRRSACSMRDEVARAVVDDGDRGPVAARRSSPERALGRRDAARAGDPARTPSRSARPSALNAASARWWSLRPAASTRGGSRRRSGRTPRGRARRAGAAARRRARRGTARSITAYGRPPTSTTAVASAFVHRHGAVAEAADPGPVAERLGERRTRARARRPRRCGARRRGGRRSRATSRSNRPWWASEPSRWS